jgi:hypothetical protein
MLANFPVSYAVLAKALVIGKENDEQRYFSSVAQRHTNHNTTTGHCGISIWQHVWGTSD